MARLCKEQLNEEIKTWWPVVRGDCFGSYIDDLVTIFNLAKISNPVEVFHNLKKTIENEIILSLTLYVCVDLLLNLIGHLLFLYVMCSNILCTRDKEVHVRQTLYNDIINREKDTKSNSTRLNLK